MTKLNAKALIFVSIFLLLISSIHAGDDFIFEVKDDKIFKTEKEVTDKNKANLTKMFIYGAVDEKTNEVTSGINDNITCWFEKGNEPTALIVARIGKATADQAMFTVNTLWILIAACLVFIMHLGFSTLEVGLTRAKNTSNILFKNVAILGIGLLTYALIGFNLMYGASGGWIGTIELGLNPGAGAQSMANANGHYPFWADFIFQGMFAATCATIVSGAVAERVKLAPFLIFSTIFVGICYPIMGNWKWGGGFLDGMGFYDFAGSTLVHSVGGWAALAAIIVLGPRIAKYGPDGKTKAIPGHSMPLATIGVFLLFFGWFGFNGGSVLSADPESVARVITMTALAGAAGIIGSMIAAWIILKKPDLSMVLNGALAGLVGITAGADQMGVIDTCVIGTIAGVLVVVAVLVFDKLKLDDPVGATSVHLVCGIWGTLAVGIFGNMKGMTQFVTQLKGVAIYGIATLISAFAILFIIKMAMGFRVTKEEEIIGLDIEEHGMEAYAGFQIFNNQ